MNHVDPAVSSGSSPGVTDTLTYGESRIPAEGLESPSFHRLTSPIEARVLSNPAESLVVNKRKLPTILRNEVPALRAAGTTVEILIATPDQLWGVLHSDVGKQIKYTGRVAVITNVHPSIRQIEIDGWQFWVPRRAASRKNLKQKRRRYLYDEQIKLLPCYTNEPLTETIPFPQWENWMSQNLYNFTKSLGEYENGLIPESSIPTLQWMMSMQRPTKRERALLEQKTREKFDRLRAQLRERILRKIIGEGRLSDKKQLAVYDVLGLGQPIEPVATARQISAVSLENTVRRIITKLNQAYQEALNSVKQSSVHKSFVSGGRCAVVAFPPY